VEDIIKSIVLGILEGLTEFLPVSSTGHLILAGDLMNFEGPTADTFKVVIQFGAVLAVLLLYWRRFWEILMDAVRLRFAERGRLNATHLLLGLLPAGALGVIFHDFIKSLFSPGMVVASLVLGGILMIVAEHAGRRVTSEQTDDITYAQALGIGAFQILALWPGFSRSGSTISGGLLLGVSKKAAADFTFIISVPIMLGASALDLYESRDLLTADNLTLMLIGFIAAFIVAMLAVVTFLKVIKRLSLTWFAVYRFAIAILFYLIVLR